jgi:drug/metabolite transporter (DMT)-like permease
VGVPPVTTLPALTPRVRVGVPTWAVAVVVALGVLVFVGGSNSGSVLLPVLGLVVAVIGLVPTTISAYFDFRAHQRRNQSRTGTDREES